MTPFWIVNFLEGDSCESFFQSYWDALKANTIGAPEPLKFFHITDGRSETLTREKLNEIAFQSLSMNTAEADKLIPAFTNNQGNSINVIFIGDVTQDKTMERFHTWAAFLQQQRMADVNRPWFSISSVKMYGILLRPESLTVDDKALTKRMKGFLNELNSLERMPMNYRPFDQVLFLQSSMKPEGRAAAEQAVNIAAYHIARTNGQCFKDYDILYYDANATAVFFETDAQKEIDACNLGAVLLKDMTGNQEEHFLNVNEARAFVDDNQRFVDTFKPANMKRFLISECPRIPGLEITKFSCKLNVLNVIPIWRDYNTKHIEKVVNNVTQELSSFEKDFIRCLNLRQHKFIFDSSHGLQDLVFQMFCDKGNPRFKHIGLQQAMKVLEHFKIKIKDAFKNLEKAPEAFVLPGDLDKLMKKSKRLDISSDMLQNELRKEIDALSKLKKEILISSLSTGVVISAALYPLSIWGLAMLPVAALIGAIAFLIRVKRIERLKDLFVGAKLLEIRARLDELATKLQEKTVEEMSQYMQWLHEKKLARLQNEMSVIVPPGFHFQESKAFQPLLAGSFGHAPLVVNVPTIQIPVEEDNSTVDIYDLAKGYKKAVQGLVKELMYSDETISDTEVEGVQFQAHETVATGQKMLLLLDVSGSMEGDITKLRQYVHKLEAVAEIEWIAFADEVVTTSRSASIDSIGAYGGTNYIPAIRRAVDWMQTSTYDVVLLLSDGIPFEELDDIVSAAHELKMPLNTVAVGASPDTEEMLVNIALRTGGKEVTVDSYEQICMPDVWNNEILPNIELVNKGEYSFGQLMKYMQLKACASALRKFALNRIGDYSLTIPALINGYMNPNGFNEWLDASAQRNTLSPRAEQMREAACFSAVEGQEMIRMTGQLQTLCNQHNTIMHMDASAGEPDTVVSLMSLRPLLHISDLQWSATMKHDDATINDRDGVVNLLLKQGELVNIYDEPIK